MYNMNEWKKYEANVVNGKNYILVEQKSNISTLCQSDILKIFINAVWILIVWWRVMWTKQNVNGLFEKIRLRKKSFRKFSTDQKYVGLKLSTDLILANICSVWPLSLFESCVAYRITWSRISQHAGILRGEHQDLWWWTLLNTRISTRFRESDSVPFKEILRQIYGLAEFKQMLTKWIDASEVFM